MALRLGHFAPTRKYKLIFTNISDVLSTTSSSSTGSGAVVGVGLADRTEIRAGAVVLTTGTFLRGEIHVGTKSFPAGRRGDAPAIGLAQKLDACDFELGRLKTGTPPRLARESIDFSELPEQPSDPVPLPFSYMNSRVTNEGATIPCHLTYTNEETHRPVRPQASLPDR